MKLISVNDIPSNLDAYGIKVDVRPTHELFPHREFDLNHFSIVCVNEQEQYRVYHWLQFMTPHFKNFTARAVLIVMIEPEEL
ncbi:MAG: hypothetical protein V3T23_08445 [Nitrososphaerales archaeon]